MLLVSMMLNLLRVEKIKELKLELFINFISIPLMQYYIYLLWILYRHHWLEWCSQMIILKLFLHTGSVKLVIQNKTEYYKKLKSLQARFDPVDRNVTETSSGISVKNH